MDAFHGTQHVNHNETVSLDWGIINKKAKTNEKNVFALFLDTNNVFVYAAESRGQAGPALEAYMQQCGKPQEIVHDNAQEFTHGTFKDICLNQTNDKTNKEPTFRSKQKPSRTLHGYSYLHDEIHAVHIRPKS
jgi:hypothetical protein